MSLVAALVDGLRPKAVGDPDDERYWSGSYPVLPSDSGISITPDVSFMVSCFFQGVRLISETVASVPLILYRELDQGGKERARDHWLWAVLRNRPNPWQSSQQWREMMTAHAVAWGFGVSEIKYTGRTVELWPLDPARTEVDQLDSGRIRAHVTDDRGHRRTLVHDQLFRLHGLGIQGLSDPYSDVDHELGVNVVALARNALGLWHAMEKYSSFYFRRGASPSFGVEHPKVISEPAKKRLQAEMEERAAGLRNAHRPIIIEEGSKFHDLKSSTAKDSQLVEAREAMVYEVARWLNIPEHMFRAGKQPTYASVEQFAREFIDYTNRPWWVRWEQSLGRDLLSEEDVFAEHLIDGLLRGNTLDRFQAYATGIMNGFLSENEARARENLNPWPGLDEPRRSVNQDRGAEPRKKEQASRRLRLIAQEAVNRVVRREVSAVTSRAERLAGQPEEWHRWLKEFYDKHAGLVAEALQLEPVLSKRYAERQYAALVQHGIAALDVDGMTQQLESLALEE